MFEFTGPEVAALAGMPYVALVKYVDLGVVSPSVRQGEGREPMPRWSFTDLVALSSLSALRPSPTARRTLKSLFDAWHGPVARELVEAAVAAAAGRASPPPRVYLVVAGDGRVVFETETDLAVLIGAHGPRVYIIDAPRLIEAMLLAATEKRMIVGARKNKPRRTPTRTKKRVKYPTLLLEAARRYGGGKSATRERGAQAFAGRQRRPSHIVQMD